jgi:hypothetical protein
VPVCFDFLHCVALTVWQGGQPVQLTLASTPADHVCSFPFLLSLLLLPGGQGCQHVHLHRLPITSADHVRLPFLFTVTFLCVSCYRRARLPACSPPLPPRAAARRRPS